MPAQPTLTAKAVAVASLLPATPGVSGVDPLTIIEIIKLLFSIYECFHSRPAVAASYCHTPGILSRVRLHRAVRQAMPDAATVDRLRVVNAMLTVGCSTTEGEISGMSQEIKAG